MLPYGTLWKLDQMLHPVGPPQRRTVAMRRRQALFYFLWGVFLLTIFLFPYHYASLRRLRLDGARRLRGASAPEVNPDVLRQQEESALERLKQQMAARNGKGKGNAEHTVSTPTSITADFAMAFYYHPKMEIQLRGAFGHPLLRTIAGAGSSRLWKSLGGDITAPAAPDAAYAVHRLTVAEAAVAKLNEGPAEPAICLAALRRDYLASRLNTSAHMGTELTRAVRAAHQRFSTLYPLSLSSEQTAFSIVSANTSSIETALAQLFLWLSDDASLPGEAISRAVAGCTAPLSRSLEVSFDWQARPSVEAPRTELLATVREGETVPPQYVCLCYGRNSLHATPLTGTADAESSVLFLVDHRDPKRVTFSDCKDVCSS
ncbi:hypothetical protein ABL78_7752 [Leptomonas seymouri]|uniref:Transmembrane protein n=1 Tax=Leptomonas seymouri TaxID=5684 RepID=A0A0N1IGT9_LEPSE|nr:hypothetical protein ABL78_7752 [Leptomonas seymouri]|eukprot:KPI83224.1 hypothetical protein ABL78_7752 [Leptomonas seymouri]